MYDAGATYVLYPTGYTRTTDITPDLFCAIRQYHGLSQSELGALLDVSEDAVANEERGRSRISTRGSCPRPETPPQRSLTWETQRCPER